MKRILTMSLAALVAAAVAAPILAQAPAPTPSWPPGKQQVFVWADTVNAPAGNQSNLFERGAAVVFRAYAVDLKSKKVLTGKDVQFFYVKIPGQPNLKMSYSAAAGAKGLWTATWTIPTTYPAGVVDFRILVKTKAKHYGAFAQAPVAAAQLTVTTQP
jgi:hypothetical protein